MLLGLVGGCECCWFGLICSYLIALCGVLLLNGGTVMFGLFVFCGCFGCDCFSLYCCLGLQVVCIVSWLVWELFVAFVTCYELLVVLGFVWGAFCGVLWFLICGFTVWGLTGC